MRTNENGNSKPLSHSRKLVNVEAGIVVLILAVVAIVRLIERDVFSESMIENLITGSICLIFILTLGVVYQAIMTIIRKEPNDAFKIVGLTGILFLSCVWIGMISFILVDLLNY